VIDLVETAPSLSQNTRPSPWMSSLFTTSRPSELARLLFAQPLITNLNHRRSTRKRKRGKKRDEGKLPIPSTHGNPNPTHPSIGTRTRSHEESKLANTIEEKEENQLATLPPLSSLLFPRANQRRSHPPSSQPSETLKLSNPILSLLHQTQATLMIHHPNLPHSVSPDLKGQSFPSDILPWARVCNRFKDSRPRIFPIQGTTTTPATSSREFFFPPFLRSPSEPSSPS